MVYVSLKAVFCYLIVMKNCYAEVHGGNTEHRKVFYFTIKKLRKLSGILNVR